MSETPRPPEESGQNQNDPELNAAVSRMLEQEKPSESPESEVKSIFEDYEKVDAGDPVISLPSIKGCKKWIGDRAGAADAWIVKNVIDPPIEWTLNKGRKADAWVADKIVEPSIKKVEKFVDKHPRRTKFLFIGIPIIAAKFLLYPFLLVKLAAKYIMNRGNMTFKEGEEIAEKTLSFMDPNKKEKK